MQKPHKTFAFWLFLALLGLLLLAVVRNQGVNKAKPIAFRDFIAAVEAGNVDSLVELERRYEGLRERIKRKAAEQVKISNVTFYKHQI